MNTDEVVSHKYTLYISGDGNFKLQLKRKNRTGRDVHLMTAFFQTPEELDLLMKHAKPVTDVSGSTLLLNCVLTM